MGRGVDYFCARSSMPVPPSLEVEQPSPQPDVKHAPETMTWQQQDEFGASKKPKGRNKVKWVPLVESAIEDPINNSWIEQQAEFNAQIQGSRRRARGKAPNSLSPLDAKRSPPAQTTLLTPPPLNSNTGEASNLPKKTKPRRRKKKHTNPDKMTVPATMSAPATRSNKSIPPHLRRRIAALEAKKAAMEGAAVNGAAASTEPKKDSAVSLTAANASPTTSDKSKAVQGVKLHSSPLGAKDLSKSPPSPPTTAQESEKVDESKLAPVKPQHPAGKASRSKGPTANKAQARKQVQQGNFASWDKPKSPPTPSRRFGNPHKYGIPHWSRFPQQTYKKTQWPKARDIKRLPSESDGGGIGFKSDSNGDVDYDVKKLLDWNGDWLPPPESWAARKGYSNRHFTDSIDKWININPALLRPVAIQEPAFSGRQTKGGPAVEYIAGKTIAGVNEYNEIVPRRWIDTRVEDKTLREYWTDMSKKAPEALPGCDIMANPPWWDRYTDESSCYITSLTVPEAKVNMLDEENPVAQQDLGCVEDKLNIIFQRRHAQHKRIMEKRSRPLYEIKSLALPAVESRGIKPKANIFLRPVQPADVRGIAAIYNWYVEKTIYTNEFDGRSEGQIRRRVNDVTTAGLPYIVAVAPSAYTRGHADYIEEKVVGFISLDDYVDQSSMFRFTFDMELFVHPGFKHKRISQCLLDKLLEIVDTSYKARAGYSYRNESEYLKTGLSRVVKTILLNVYHESTSDPEWQTKLLDAFDFKPCGRMPGIGYKHGKVVDVSIFSHQTTEDIDASAKPSVPLERN
ncbi:hypothetical protein J1614_006821 [Plenodomus biglobosus]|nr:hypothetical protein J1614_006821 [Plenodomus biglobosus]